ncbi:restriction endonuclease [Shewanella fodinae]|uniref:restriction endonuclease n=1 Tax=Shewanella fodinae TaxID=552357 RepID=UPI0016723E93|nr:restriction endonuclease [Shewanella fodinae]MCL2908102.1 hypothetical protein [Shewanella fodinae]GGZ01231.1 hypothetical protein GCM10007169_17520 [Shewanella fodinae]
MLSKEQFELFLDKLSDLLASEAKAKKFSSASIFENRVREVAQNLLKDSVIDIDFSPHQQAFPDIAIGNFGIEVKFTTNDTWRSVANSVLETNRIQEVKEVYLIFGKMGGEPDVRWQRYEDCVMHVRTSHVPRFEVEIGTEQSLFSKMSVGYDNFRMLPMHEKMQYIRQYARGRLKDGERLWWLEDSDGEEHSLPIQARLYTKLSKTEKSQLRAEAVLLCPNVLGSGRAKNKYDDAVLYLLTYHGVLCHQARDLFSAGSVANPDNDDNGGLYIERAMKLLEHEIAAAAQRMDGALFFEYWGIDVAPEQRIREWLKRADEIAKGWVPSKTLFKDTCL